jgi:mannan endo-1,4-beta-mannosidase
MLKMLFFVILAGLLSCMSPRAQAGSTFSDFVTRSGDKLMESGHEYRFISVNIPNLHLIEDHLPFTSTNSWRLPTEYEMRDALLSVKQMGGQAVRIYTLSVKKHLDDGTVPNYVTGPGQFNEEAFRTFDLMMKISGEVGVRLIIPFVDQWSWFGGIAEYAAFRGKPADAFWTDPQLLEDFKQTVSFVVNRINTLTGIRYKDDKTILAWETGNELLNPVSWSREISRYLKEIDPNHLVLDGFHAGDRGLKEEAILDPNVDIVGTHHYGLPGKGGDVFLDFVRKNRERTASKKAYLLGEFGFIPAENVQQVLNEVLSNGTAGALIWSLRFHTREGGFYWHSEPFGLGIYKAYHWPGFPSGEGYEETKLLSLLREKAFEIQGKPLPSLDPPAAPILLPIQFVSAISWQGSAGAVSYNVERAEKSGGPWLLAGMNIDDAGVQYRPLFNDTFAVPGKSYYYRVRAYNGAGGSGPSNEVGPVKASSLQLVDEMRDFSLLFGYGGKISLDGRSSRKAKEDSHRIKGNAGSYLVYRTSRPIEAARIFAFFPAEVSALTLQASSDGLTFLPLEISRKDFFKESAEYGYWKPVLFEALSPPRRTLFLKIELNGETQIGRVEIDYGK